METKMKPEYIDTLETLVLAECTDDGTREVAREVFRRARAHSEPVIVSKDGTWQRVPVGHEWEYTNDPDFLVCIMPEPAPQGPASARVGQG